MTRSIYTYIGPSRTAPAATVDDRILPPTGTQVPRPFDIQHILRTPKGRSTGGFLMLSDYDGMDWIYSVGTTALYTRFLSLYVPTNPWVWVQVFSPFDDAAIWWEAVMLEPRLDRGAGNTVVNLVVSFRHILRN